MPVQTEHRFPLDLSVLDAAGVVRYRLATALPTGSFDGPTLQAAIDRPSGANRPPQRAAKG